MLLLYNRTIFILNQIFVQQMNLDIFLHELKIFSLKLKVILQ